MNLYGSQRSIRSWISGTVSGLGVDPVEERADFERDMPTWIGDQERSILPAGRLHSTICRS